MTDTAAGRPRGLPRLTAAQTAARLGVKPASLYAYVSRGLLGRERGVDGSTFDPLEVEAFAASRRGSGASPPPEPSTSGSPLMTIESNLALLEDDELYYRGVAVTELTGAGFEAVSRWVWTGQDAFGRDPSDQDPATSGGAVAGVAFTTPADVAQRLSRVLAPGSGVPMPALDRLRLQLIAAAGADPLRNDLEDETVIRQAGVVLSVLVDAVGPGRAGGASLAGRLFERLTDRPATAERVGVLDAALVLLLDHDLAASTMAVRAAASARANLYAAVGTGLGALDSALHGNVSRASHRLLARVLDDEPVDLVLAETVVETGGVPGFGHRVYRRRDPRAVALLELLDGLPDSAPVLGAVRSVEAAVLARRPTFPNIDLALAAMAHTLGMGGDAGTAVFAIGRTSGWVSHVLQEYREPALRLRPVGRYVGP